VGFGVIKVKRLYRRHWVINKSLDKAEGTMVEVSLTVGKLDASLALLLTKDHHLIEFPTILLPDGISAGSIVKITCERDISKEIEEKKQFNNLQEEIFEIFGKHEPQNPILKTVNITQTSCVLEWEPLNLGTAELKELTLYKNGSKLGPIKNPFQKKNIKFSGLPIDTPYKFQLKLETSSGIYYSNLLEIRTHKMTDLSGITVCIGDIDYNEENFTLSDIEDAIKSIGAKPYSNQVKVDTTQFICTKNSGIEYQKAKNMNIPIIRPEWIKACQLERRIVGVNKFYLDTENPIWKTKNFWIISNDISKQSEEPESRVEPNNNNTIVESHESNIVPSIVVDHAEEEHSVQPEDGSEQAKIETEVIKSEPIENVEESIKNPSEEIISEPIIESAGVVEQSLGESVEVDNESNVGDSVSAVQEPVFEKIVAEKPVAEEPVADEPVADEPVADEPVADEPVADEPVADEPVADEPVADEPVADEPVADEPVADEPVAEQPIAEEPAAEEPLAEEQISEKPVTEEAIVKDPVAQALETPNEITEPEIESAEPEVDDSIDPIDSAQNEDTEEGEINVETGNKSNSKKKKNKKKSKKN
jgi:hypothetical protein